MTREERIIYLREYREEGFAAIAQKKYYEKNKEKIKKRMRDYMRHKRHGENNTEQ